MTGVLLSSPEGRQSSLPFARQASLSFTISESLLKFISIESVMLPNSLPPSSFAFNLSQYQGLFQRVDFSHQMAKVLELQQQFFQ